MKNSEDWYMIHLKNAYGMLKSCLDEAIKRRKKKRIKRKEKKEVGKKILFVELKSCSTVFLWFRFTLLETWNYDFEGFYFSD